MNATKTVTKIKTIDRSNKQTTMMHHWRTVRSGDPIQLPPTCHGEDYLSDITSIGTNLLRPTRHQILHRLIQWRSAEENDRLYSLSALKLVVIVWWGQLDGSRDKKITSIGTNFLRPTRHQILYRLIQWPSAEENDRRYSLSALKLVVIVWWGELDSRTTWATSQP